MTSARLVLLSAAVAAQSALATQVKIVPAEVAKVDLGKLKGGMASQLAWSPDGKQLYLQTLTEDKQALPKDYYHYVIPAEGGTFEKVEAPPEWAVAYWAWKQAKTAPDDKTFAIDIGQDKRVASATAIPMGGELAKGGTNPGTGGASGDSMMAAAMSSSNATIYTMLLKGETIGEWINHRIMPGVTFGWGPAGSHLIAFSEKQTGRLVIMDSTGAKQKIEGTHGVVLPAWSADGTRLAYLEGRGRNQYALIVATVAAK
jgi:hypothetical protein